MYNNKIIKYKTKYNNIIKDNVSSSYNNINNFLTNTNKYYHEIKDHQKSKSNLEQKNQNHKSLQTGGENNDKKIKKYKKIIKESRKTILYYKNIAEQYYMTNQSLYSQYNILFNILNVKKNELESMNNKMNILDIYNQSNKEKLEILDKTLLLLKHNTTDNVVDLNLNIVADGKLTNVHLEKPPTLSGGGNIFYILRNANNTNIDDIYERLDTFVKDKDNIQKLSFNIEWVIKELEENNQVDYKSIYKLFNSQMKDINKTPVLIAERLKDLEELSDNLNDFIVSNKKKVNMNLYVNESMGIHQDGGSLIVLNDSYNKIVIDETKKISEYFKNESTKPKNIQFISEIIIINDMMTLSKIKIMLELIYKLDFIIDLYNKIKIPDFYYDKSNYNKELKNQWKIIFNEENLNTNFYDKKILENNIYNFMNSSDLFLNKDKGSQVFQIVDAIINTINININNINNDYDDKLKVLNDTIIFIECLSFVKINININCNYYLNNITNIDAAIKVRNVLLIRNKSYIANNKYKILYISEKLETESSTKTTLSTQEYDYLPLLTKRTYYTTNFEILSDIPDTDTNIVIEFVNISNSIYSKSLYNDDELNDKSINLKDQYKQILEEILSKLNKIGDSINELYNKILNKLNIKEPSKLSVTENYDTFSIIHTKMSEQIGGTPSDVKSDYFFELKQYKIFKEVMNQYIIDSQNKDFKDIINCIDETNFDSIIKSKTDNINILTCFEKKYNRGTIFKILNEGIDEINNNKSTLKTNASSVEGVNTTTNTSSIERVNPTINASSIEEPETDTKSNVSSVEIKDASSVEGSDTTGTKNNAAKKIQKVIKEYSSKKKIKVSKPSFTNDKEILQKINDRPRLKPYIEKIIKSKNNIKTFLDFKDNILRLISEKQETITIDELKYLLLIINKFYDSYNQGILNYTNVLPMIILTTEFTTKDYNKDECKYEFTYDSKEISVNYESKNESGFKGPGPPISELPTSEPLTSELPISDTCKYIYNKLEYKAHNAFLYSNNNVTNTSIYNDPIIGIDKIQNVNTDDPKMPINLVSFILFTLGSSGTGKTFRLFGDNSLENKGIIQQTIEKMSDTIEISYFICYGQQSTSAPTSTPTSTTTSTSSGAKNFKELILFFNYDEIKERKTEVTTEDKTKIFMENIENKCSTNCDKYYIPYINDNSELVNIDTYTDYYSKLVNKKLLRINYNTIKAYIEAGENYPVEKIKEDISTLKETTNFRDLLKIKDSKIWSTINKKQIQEYFDTLLKEQKKIKTILPTKNNIESSRGHTFIIIRDNDKYNVFIDMAGTENCKDMREFLFDTSNTSNTSKKYKIIQLINKITQEKKLQFDDNTPVTSLKNLFNESNIKEYLKPKIKKNSDIEHSGGGIKDEIIDEVSGVNIIKSTVINFLNKIVNEGHYINHTIGMLILLQSLNSACLKSKSDGFDTILDKKLIDKLRKVILNSKLNTKLLIQDISYNDILNNNSIWVQVLISLLYWNEESDHSLDDLSKSYNKYISTTADSKYDTIFNSINYQKYVNDNTKIYLDLTYHQLMNINYDNIESYYKNLDSLISKNIIKYSDFNESNNLVIDNSKNNIIQNIYDNIIIYLNSIKNETFITYFIYQLCFYIVIQIINNKDEILSYSDKDETNKQILKTKYNIINQITININDYIDKDHDNLYQMILKYYSINKSLSGIINKTEIDQISPTNNRLNKDNKKLYNNLISFFLILSNKKNLSILTNIDDIFKDKIYNILTMQNTTSDNRSIMIGYVKSIFSELIKLKKKSESELETSSIKIPKIIVSDVTSDNINDYLIQEQHNNDKKFLSLLVFFNIKLKKYNDFTKTLTLIKKLKNIKDNTSKNNETNNNIERIKDGRITPTKNILLFLVTGETYKSEMVSETINLVKQIYENTDIDLSSI